MSAFVSIVQTSDVGQGVQTGPINFSKRSFVILLQRISPVFHQNNLLNFSITNIRRGVKFKEIFWDKNVVLYSAIYGKYGAIHGRCILVKNVYASNCSVVTECMSESVLRLHISKSVIGYEFILDAVYLPHEASTYYSDNVLEYFIGDMTTIRAKYDVPTILMGDKTGTTSDFELIYDYDKLFMDNDPYMIYFEKEDIFHRQNKDKHMNRKNIFLQNVRHEDFKWKNQKR